jgi:hypothetical protein
LKISACSGSLLAVMVTSLHSLLTMCDISKWEELYSSSMSKQVLWVGLVYLNCEIIWDWIAHALCLMLMYNFIHLWSSYYISVANYYMYAPHYYNLWRD